jgi:uncharacterized radical SAM superfamily protein
VEDFYISASPRFVDVSITGKNCELMCDHCASKILWHMIPATTPEELKRVGEELKAKGIEGILISGGSNKDGVVELYPFFEAIEYLKRELGLITTCHVGLVDKKLAKGLKEAGVDAVLMDVIGDDRTIAEVYKLPHKSVKDYEESLALLKEYNHKIVPHVIIGLHYGKVLGEYRAIDVISKFDPDGSGFSGSYALLRKGKVPTVTPTHAGGVCKGLFACKTEPSKDAGGDRLCKTRRI